MALIFIGSYKPFVLIDTVRKEDDKKAEWEDIGAEPVVGKARTRGGKREKNTIKIGRKE